MYGLTSNSAVLREVAVHGSYSTWIASPVSSKEIDRLQNARHSQINRLRVRLHGAPCIPKISLPGSQRRDVDLEEVLGARVGLDLDEMVSDLSQVD